jgi:hypothetical protein
VLANAPIGTHFFEEGIETPLTSGIDGRTCVARGTGTSVILSSPGANPPCLWLSPEENDTGNWQLLVDGQADLPDACLARIGQSLTISGDCSGDTVFSDSYKFGEAFALKPAADASVCLEISAGQPTFTSHCTTETSLWYDDGEVLQAGAGYTVVICAGTGPETLGAGCAAALAAFTGVVVIYGVVYLAKNTNTAWVLQQSTSITTPGAKGAEWIYWAFHRTRPAPIAGGTYGQTKGRGAHGHHVVTYTAMPPNMPNGCKKDAQPAVRMEEVDHAKTASYKNKNPQWIADQKALVDGNDFVSAFNKGIQDVLAATGNKYVDGLKLAAQEARKYLTRCGGGGDPNNFIL